MYCSCTRLHKSGGSSPSPKSLILLKINGLIQLYGNSQLSDKSREYQVNLKLNCQHTCMYTSAEQHTRISCDYHMKAV